MNELISSVSDRAAVWTARTLILGMALVLGWYTWGHWGDLQIDSGREMYVPVDLLRGKLLFRDIWYQYGPLTPYVQAAAFYLFGPSLNVLYVMGMILVICSALLLFEIGRNFQFSISTAVAPAVFFLSESFRSSIFNFVFPYSYTASMAASFGLGCLYLTIRHLVTGRLRYLPFAALCTSLAILTKQEFGLACLAILGLGAMVPCFTRQWHELIPRALACASGLLPTTVVYGLFVWKVSAKTIFIENWVMTPGTYTMKTIGRFAMANQGIRFGLSEWSLASFGVVISLTLWFAIAHWNAFAIRELKLRRLRSFVLVMAADVLVALIILRFGTSVWPGSAWLMAQVVFPKGIFLIACGFAIFAIWRALRTRGEAIRLAEAALGIYAVLVGIRTMMEMWAIGYAVFFNIPAFLVFSIVVARIVFRASGSLDEQRRKLLVGCMLGTEAALLAIVLFPRHAPLSSPLKTQFGTIYTEEDRAVLFPQIISFMKTHTRNGKDILVLPESASLYYFSGMESPSRWYEAQPGVLDPDQEQQLINDSVTSGVRYVLLCNRSVDEYGIAPFGVGYDLSIYKWINQNFTKVHQFGPRADLLSPATVSKHYQPYVMEVYERKSPN